MLFGVIAHLGYCIVVGWTYLAVLWHRDATSPLSAPTTDPSDPSATGGSGSWSWLGALFSPLGDSTIAVVDRTPPVSFAARPASFGKRITEDDGPVVGYLIPLDAFATTPEEGNACPGTSVRDGFSIPDEGETWIAVVQRGGCGFAAKVLTAQAFGARAVLVGNSEPNIDIGERDGLVQMYAPGQSGANVTVPSAFITFATYTRLLHLIDKGNTTTSGYKTLSLVMLPEVGGWEWYSPVLTFLALLLLPSLLTLITLLLHRVRVARARRADRAPEEVVFALPWRVWGERGLLGDGDDDQDDKSVEPVGTGGVSIVGSGEQTTHIHTYLLPHSLPTPVVATERTPLRSANTMAASTSRVDFTRLGPPPVWFASQTQCTICLGDFERGDRVRILPCRHVFHLEEVDAWLICRKKVCPICKADVTAHLRALSAAQESRWRQLARRAWALVPSLPVLPTAGNSAGAAPTPSAGTTGPGDVESGYGATAHADQSQQEDERWLSISERLARREARASAAVTARGSANAEQQQRATAVEEWIQHTDDDRHEHEHHTEDADAHTPVSRGQSPARASS